MNKKNGNTEPEKNQNPEPVPETNPQVPEPPKESPIKVGDIVAIKPMVGVVYENGNKGSWGGADFRVQLADGTKVKVVDRKFWQPAGKLLEMSFLKTAPEELKPEAIIAREAAEANMSVEDFMAGVAGGHEPVQVEHEAGEDDNSSEDE